MTQQDTIYDSPTDWVRKHIHSYIETDGRSGHEWKGAPTLLLVTRGRKSGKLRRTALIYGDDGDRYVIVASHGGNAKHPTWYLNLIAHPDVEVQINGEKFSAMAQVASAEEKARLWPMMTAIWPAYDDYQARTQRNIPVIVLTRKSE
jgi:deazaflavin-dependent oxidoreductase (nitroreductase family)